MENLDAWLGREDVCEDKVSVSAVERYCVSLGCAFDETNGVVPLGFHWCLCTPTSPTSELDEDGHPAKGSFLPPISLPRRMWAASHVEFKAPIKIGDAIKRVSKILSIKQKKGRSGKLVFVEIGHTIYANSEEVIFETQTLVYREAATHAIELPALKGGGAKEGFDFETILPTSPLLFRYSAISFNTHRIHYDLPYAKKIEGYPALVVQAPLMASLLLKHASKKIEASHIKSFAFRGLAPAFCDQSLHVFSSKTDTEIELGIMGADGRDVMSAKIYSAP